MFNSQNNSMKKQSFLYGVSILFFASVIAKILGAVYRVPITWILGPEGLGLYQLVYPLFALIIVLSSTSMPTAISKIVADYIYLGDYANAKKTFVVSLKLVSVVGLIFAILLASFSGLIASFQGNDMLYLGYLGLAPAVVLVSVLSAFRGYFQGLSDMMPTAVSQVIEQGAKLVFGLVGAYLLIPFGVEYGTLGALLGVSVSELLAVLFMVIVYRKKRNKRYYSAQNEKHSTIHNSIIKEQGTKQIAKRLLKTALPIVLSNAILPFVLFVESIFVIKLLMSGGLSSVEATGLWGINSGVVNSLVNMPIVLTQAIAISLVPFVAGKGKTQNMCGSYDQAVGLGVAFCVPVVVAFVLLGEPILSILYMNSLGVSNLSLATMMLAICSCIVVLGSILQIQNSLLYGLGYGRRSLINMAIAASIQVALFVLLTIYLGIWGCVISSISFYLFAFLLDYLFIRFRLGYRLSFVTLKPIFFGAIILILFILDVCMLFENLWTQTIISILGGGVLYVFSLWAFGGFKLFVKKKTV